MKYTFKDLNFPYQFNLMYKQLGLDDFDFVILLNVYHILEKNPKLLITTDVLCAFMSSDKDKIDKKLVSLQDRGFIEYLNDNDYGVFTSIDKLVDKVFQKTILNIRAEEYLLINKNSSTHKNCVQVIQEAIQRDLNIHELQKIGQFISEGITESKIISSVSYLQNRGNFSFPILNRYLLALLNSNRNNKLDKPDDQNINFSSSKSTFKTKGNSKEIDISLDLDNLIKSNNVKNNDAKQTASKTTKKESKEDEFTKEELENFNWYDE